MSDYPPGTHIGPYVVKRTLSEGGMGRLLVVTAPTNDEELALKVIKWDEEDSLAYRAEGELRFQREGRLLEDLRRLKHPHILKFVTLGYHSEDRYLVTELLKGDTLFKLLATAMRTMDVTGEHAPSRLPVWLFRECATQLLDALETLHRHGIAHRDLKPDNVMTTEPSRTILTTGSLHLKLIDFGIGLAEDNARLTVRGMLGTYQYSAPELVSRADDTLEVLAQACARDRFALGLVLYELWTGKPFWQLAGRDQWAALKRAIQTFEELHDRASEELSTCPLKAVVIGLLHRLPEDRLHLREAIALTNGSVGVIEPASTGDLSGPVPYQGETYRSDVKPVSPPRVAAFQPPQAEVEVTPDLPKPPNMQPVSRPAMQVAKSAGLAVIVLFAIGGAFLGLRELTGGTLSPATVDGQGEPSTELGTLAVATVDDRQAGKREAQVAPTNTPAAVVDITNHQPPPPPLRPSSVALAPMNTTKTQGAREEVLSNAKAEREPQAHEAPTTAKPQTPLELQRLPKQPQMVTTTIGKKPVEPVSASPAVGGGPLPSAPVPEVSDRVAAVPTRKLVLSRSFLFERGDAAPENIEADGVKIRALRPNAPARAMEAGTVFSVSKCSPGSKCTVELLHFEGAISRYEGCSATPLVPKMEVKRGDVVCYLEDDSYLSVSVLARRSTDQSDLFSVDPISWRSIEILDYDRARKPQ